MDARKRKAGSGKIRLEFALLGEEFTAAQLHAAGWTIEARNYRTVGSELDIVAAKGNTLAIIEVKTRRERQDSGNIDRVEGLLNFAKKRALIRGAKHFLRGREYVWSTVRFDLALVAVKKKPDSESLAIRYIPGAFSALDLDD